MSLRNIFSRCNSWTLKVAFERIVQPLGKASMHFSLWRHLTFPHRLLDNLRREVKDSDDAHKIIVSANDRPFTKSDINILARYLISPEFKFSKKWQNFVLYFADFGLIVSPHIEEYSEENFDLQFKFETTGDMSLHEALFRTRITHPLNHH